MTNTIRVGSAAALFLAAAAFAAVVVEEDFEGAKFPPDGWERVQTRGIWTREHAGAPYNWCAYFYSFGLAGGSGVLRTTGQDIQAGDYRVTFAYSYRITGGGGTTAYVRVQRRTGSTWQLIAAQLLPLSSSFRSFALGHSANAAGTYRLLFEAEAEVSAAVYFRVDNVLWQTAPSSGIAPASLGSVKALYY
jgi:hypothetical protein